jgi:hypothetical protein
VEVISNRVDMFQTRPFNPGASGHHKIWSGTAHVGSTAGGYDNRHDELLWWCERGGEILVGAVDDIGRGRAARIHMDD